MNVREIGAAIREIMTHDDDPEAQHSLEDCLRDEVLRAIVELGGEAGDLATEVLKTGDLSFPRWCA